MRKILITKALVTLFLMLILFTVSNSVFSQSMCNTPPSSSYSTYNQQIHNMAETGPFYIRIYVHVIRKQDGTGGQTEDRVHQALAFLDNDYNQHNIFFIWNCLIDYINSDTYYTPVGNSQVFNINRHSDGIDIYLFPDAPPDHLTGGGLAEGIGATAFFVAGNLSPLSAAPPPYVPLIPSSVMSHEMGHCLNLWHTWEGPNNCQEYVDGTNCEVCGDLICDSPAEPLGGIAYYIDYETCTWLGSGLDPHNDPYDPDEHIIMTYTHPDCMEYFTLQQAQRMRNSIAALPILQNCLVTFPDVTISNPNVIWNTAMQISGNVIIENGAMLTISSTISFSQHSKIIVKPGGKLSVNGGILTNINTFCNYFKMWQGIEVWGNSSTHQYANSNGQYQQGYLELNNATIKNAKCAVELWKPGDYTTTGGILKATNSAFLNNSKSIHALYYRNFNPYHPNLETNYVANIKNCVFEISNQYLPNYVFNNHIDIDHVKGVSINGCDFLLASNVDGIADMNKAISSNSAGFSVYGQCVAPIEPCAQYDSCRFEGFYQGVYAIHDLSNTYTFNVSAASFKNNKYGIYATNVRNQSIKNSIFKISNFGSFGCPDAEGFGIYLEASSGFAIEQNYFAKATGASIGIYTGIRIANTNAVDDLYKNTFAGLSYGNYAEGANILSNTQIGLTYTCNLNANNYADFYVPLPNPDVSFIQQSQGSSTKPAGNTFSSTGVTWHFYNGGGSLIDYYHCSSCSYQDPDEVNKGYQLTDHTVSTVNQCPSHSGNVIPSEQEKLDLETDFVLSATNYTDVKALYDNLKDGGSTEQTLDDVQSAQSGDMWSLRAQLLGSSPHLSQDVLKLVADRTDVFTESVIFDILAANPDELKKDELLQYLEEKENPLPGYMIDILRQVAEGTTYKTVLLQALAGYSHQKASAANSLIRGYLSDTTTDLTVVRNWLDNLGGLEADRQIIATYLQEGNFTNALALATMLPELYPMDSVGQTENSLYVQLLGIYQILYNEGRHADALSESEKQFIEGLASGTNNSLKQIARGILTCFYEASYTTCLQAGAQAAYKSTRVSPGLLANVYGLTINIKPNPACEWAAFDYTLPDNTSDAILTIYDSFGKQVESYTLTGLQGQKLWDIRKLTSGIYLIRVTAGNLTISDKVILVK